MGSKLNTNKAHTLGGVCCNAQIAGVYAMQPPLWVFYSRTKFSFCVQESRIEQHLDSSDPPASAFQVLRKQLYGTALYLLKSFLH